MMLLLPRKHQTTTYKFHLYGFNPTKLVGLLGKNVKSRYNNLQNNVKDDYATSN